MIGEAEVTGGYDGCKNEIGEWRFAVATFPQNSKPGQMIFGLKAEDDSEPETNGLTEAEFRHLMAEGYGQTQEQVEAAVQACKTKYS